MTIKEYISNKFQKYGIRLSDADLLDIALSSGLDIDNVVLDENIARTNVGIARFIPELLLRPTSVSESGFSMSWDINGLKDYYSFLCKKYGLKDDLSTKPKVTFL